MSYRYVERVDGWLNTKTGLYVYPDDDEFIEVLIQQNKKLDKIVKKMTGGELK